ncbi:MAG: response regulator [bacterium]|nr:response regulator [bacterium]
MAVVFGIANQHGGFVDVDSELGVGSEFRIYLPSVKKRRVEPAHEESAEQKVGTERILLAEDEEQVRALASRILTNAGYKVHAVGDGEAAVREVRAATERFDLIVLDLIMPKMNGDQAFEAIRAEDRDIPIMFCTGYSDASINTELVLGSGSQILRKPYSMKEILTAVRRAVDGSPDTASQADV